MTADQQVYGNHTLEGHILDSHINNTHSAHWDHTCLYHPDPPSSGQQHTQMRGLLDLDTVDLFDFLTLKDK